MKDVQRGGGLLRLALVAIGWQILLVAATQRVLDRALIGPAVADPGYQLVAKVDGGFELRGNVRRRLGAGREAQPTPAESRVPTVLPLDGDLPRIEPWSWTARPIGVTGVSRATRGQLTWWLIPADGGRRCYLEAWRWSADGHRPVRWLARPGLMDRCPAAAQQFQCTDAPLIDDSVYGRGDGLLCVDGGVLRFNVRTGGRQWLIGPCGVLAATDTALPMRVLREMLPGWQPETADGDGETVVAARTADRLLLHIMLARRTFALPLPASLAPRGGHFTRLPDGSLAVSDGNRVDWLTADGAGSSAAYQLDRAGRIVHQRPAGPAARDHGPPQRRAAAWALWLTAFWLAQRSLAPTRRHQRRQHRPAWRRVAGHGMFTALAAKELREVAGPLALATAGLCLQGLRYGLWASLDGGETAVVYSDSLLRLAPALAWTGLLAALGLAWWQVRCERWDYLLSRSLLAPALITKLAVGMAGLVGVHLLAASYAAWRLLAAFRPLTWSMIAPSLSSWIVPCCAYLLAWPLLLRAEGRLPRGISWALPAALLFGVTGAALLPVPASTVQYARLAPLLPDATYPAEERCGLSFDDDGRVWWSSDANRDGLRADTCLGRLGSGPRQHPTYAREATWVRVTRRPLPTAPAARGTVVLRYASADRLYAFCRPDGRRYHLEVRRSVDPRRRIFISRRGVTDARPAPDDDFDTADGGLLRVESTRIELCDRGSVMAYGINGAVCRRLTKVAELPGLSVARLRCDGGPLLASHATVRLPHGEVRSLGELAGRDLWVCTRLVAGRLVVADREPDAEGATLAALDSAGRVMARLALPRRVER